MFYIKLLLYNIYRFLSPLPSGNLMRHLPQLHPLVPSEHLDLSTTTLPSSPPTRLSLLTALFSRQFLDPTVPILAAVNVRNTSID